MRFRKQIAQFMTWVASICSGMVLLVLLTSSLTAEAADKTIYNSPYVSFSPDGMAWTTNAGDKDVKWYPIKPPTIVESNIESQLSSLRAGQHYYRAKRTGEIPVGYWKVEWLKGQCIHGIYGQYPEYYHGIPFGTHKCFANHYSGWIAYCADCGEPITNGLIYMSRAAAESIKYIDVQDGLDYYYLCPFCNNLEQGYHPEHYCKEISYNRYRVVYDANPIGQIFQGGEGGYGGFMSPSIHMYNNVSIYEGETVTPVTRLTLNAYSRIGYRFVGWNTEPDGSGTFFADGARILNLTAENWNGAEDAEEGTVVLYAQWELTENTLQIDPNGGAFNGKSEITAITKPYGSTYVTEPFGVTPPAGFTVSFETNGGTACAPVTGTNHFAEWSMVQPFAGRFADGEYVFCAPDGTVDTLRACYAPDSITLPKPEKEGVSFGGWYLDEDFTFPAGGAGDTITPARDMILYAQWVDLKLDAEDNYIAYGGTGAVDLSWKQADGNSKTYILKQSRDLKNWSKINAVDDIGSERSVEEVFPFTERTEEYVVPYTGIYTLTLSGAQGADYGDFSGGKGGSLESTVWLQKGEVLTCTVGGKNGYNGGGRGDMFGNGGGCTVVSSDRQGVLAVAGGGGAASLNQNGGAGGSEAALLNTGYAGEDGGAGGGGGYRGGKAGAVEIHHCDAGCYKTEASSSAAGIGFYASASAVVNNGWGLTTECTGTSAKANAHTGGNMDMTLTVGNRSSYISTPHAGSLCFNAYMYIWGSFLTGASDYIIYVYDKDTNACLFSCNANTLAHTASSVQETECDKANDCPVAPYHERTRNIWTYNSTQITGNRSYAGEFAFQRHDDVWDGVHSNDTINIQCKVEIPETTKGVYLKIYTKAAGADNPDGAWVTTQVSGAYYAYNYSEKICGYKDGELIKSEPAYGGSSYVNADGVLSYSFLPGSQSGDGMLMLKSEHIGYVEEMELKNVSAPDLAAPHAVSQGSVEKTPFGESEVLVSWGEPEDNGTVYYHKAGTYLRGSVSLLSESNVTKNTLVSGLRGYFYVVDRKADTPADVSGEFTADRSVTVQMQEYVQYLHLAAVDVAGNVSETIHIQLDAESVNRKLYTGQLQIGNGENVYAASEEKTYYVRSDGVTPFLLQHNAYMDGNVTSGYQLNYTIYETEVGGQDNSTAQNIIFTPAAESPEADRETKAEDLTYSVSGVTPLGQYPYSVTRRSNWGRNLDSEQKFTLGREANGQYIHIIPGTGADYIKDGRKEIQYSNPVLDAENGITVIGDGEGPVINGLDILKDRELIDRATESVCVTVTAEDLLSGVDDFYVKIKNTDNYSEQIFYPENGVLYLEITGDEPLFTGSFTVMGCAVDNVGNVTEDSFHVTEFALETRIERILEPHTPIFKCGESGILYITTYGYADRVEVEFPAELLALNPGMNRTFDYTDLQLYRQESTLQFMIPLYTPANQNYTVTVRAYKGKKRLEDYPSLSTIEVGGTVLDGFRTRLR